MGSGTTRKTSDLATISLRKQEKGSGVGSSSSGRLSSGGVGSCPVSFRVKIPSSFRLVVGQSLSVYRVGDSAVVYDGNREVARLNGEKGKKIAACIAGGVLYKGTVKRHNNDTYGEIVRTN